MKRILSFCAFCSALTAADIHVGKDVPTIHAAIKMAVAGDTIHLEPKVYRDYAGFYLKKGEPGSHSDFFGFTNCSRETPSHITSGLATSTEE